MKPEIGICSEMTNTILRQEAEIKILQRDLAEAKRGLKVHPEDIPLLDEITEAKRQLIEAQHQNVHLREEMKEGAEIMRGLVDRIKALELALECCVWRLEDLSLFIPESHAVSVMRAIAVAKQLLKKQNE